MLKNTLNQTPLSTQEQSTNSECITDFTLAEHNRERIAFHLKMLEYYLKEEYELAT